MRFVVQPTLMAVVPAGAGMLIAVAFWLVKFNPVIVIGEFCTEMLTVVLVVFELLATSVQLMVWVSLNPLVSGERVTCVRSCRCRWPGLRRRCSWRFRWLSIRR